ncbi:MAG: DUF4493 domain-containing protein, partial [Bacteroidales bacterium]|nr:DUF4493 domain-containing protein [Bacteroidales bacterium]
MRLKFLGLLPLAALLFASCSDENGLDSGATGKLNISLKPDYSLTSSVGEDSRATQSQAPEINLADVTIHIVKDDGSVDKEFPYSELEANSTLPTGAYTLEAYYGSENDEGFEKPYFYGAAEFHIYDNETSNPEVLISLSNSMVSVTYSEAFKNYFSAYTTTLQSEAGVPVTFSQIENRPAYLKPGEIAITINATKTTGTQISLQPASIKAKAKTYYNVTFDVNGGNVGDATLTITFDDATTLEPIEIDLSDELVKAPAPVLTAKGFESGVSFDVKEGDVLGKAVQIVGIAESGIAEVTLGIQSAYLQAKGWPSSIELVGASEDEKTLLRDMGFEIAGLWNNVDKMFVIKFNKVISALKAEGSDPSHAFTVQVKDKYSKVAESPLTLAFNTNPVSLSFVAAETLYQGAKTLALTVNYTGDNLANNVKFYAINSAGGEQQCAIQSVATVTTVTEGKQYTVVIAIPATTNDLKLWADYNGIFTTPQVTVPNTYKYTLSVDEGNVWSHEATVTVSDAAAIGGKLYLNGAEYTNYTTEGANITIKGLAKATQYTVRLEDSEGFISTLVSFTTEDELAVPNGDFENLTQTISSSDILKDGIPQGGKYSIGFKYQNTQTFAISEPTGWGSINSITCNINSSNRNSWFVVPSTYNTTLSWRAYRDFGRITKTPDVYRELKAQSGDNAMVVRNVGWSNSGTTPDSSSGATTYYCKNIPAVANASAGQLFLDSCFTVRPVTLTGYYKYKLCDANLDDDEKAKVTV